jgi:putative component of toxin-antitoxin plasmid stabilization module
LIQIDRLPAAFYALPSGREPVREWLHTLDRDDRKVIGEDIKNVEFSWPIGMPLCRALGKGLWEVRSDLSNGRIARVFFVFMRLAWCCFMASSRRRRRPQLARWH